jgi:hypothetical protein
MHHEKPAMGQGPRHLEDQHYQATGKAKRVARTINWRVCADRSQAGGAAREAHLRSLMGFAGSASSGPRQGPG